MISLFNPYALLGMAVVVGVVGWKAYDLGGDRCEAAHAATALKQAAVALALTQAAQNAVNKTGSETVRRIEVVRTVTRTIIQKVPVYVTPAIDRRYPVPYAFLRVYNASANGRAVSDIPLPPGKSDGDPSPTPFSTVAAIAAENNGEHRACIEQVNGLQKAWQALVILHPPTQ